jgi:SP family general alpha glucoside:H+ symporter-like MFS transporter
MCISLILIGILNVWTDRKEVDIAQAVLTLVWTFIFQLSAGQLGWALPAEMGSTRLRQKTICIAKNVNGITGLVVGVLQQYFMNPQAWNLKGYVGYVFLLFMTGIFPETDTDLCLRFVWGGTCFLVLVWSFFRLPETWNRSYEELDILFAKNVPARKFASTEVNIFEDYESGMHVNQ